MPKLAELLKETLFFTLDGGDPAPPPAPTPARPRTGLEELIEADRPGAREGAPDVNGYWDFEVSDSGVWGPSRGRLPDTTFREVKYLRCWVERVGYRNLVCESVRWADPVVEIAAGAKYVLPLTEQYRAATWTARGTKTTPPRTHALWPLPAVMDVGFQHLFGYHFPDGADRPPKPLSPARLWAVEFQRPGRATVHARPGPPQSVAVNKPCVVVCVSLVCCRPSTDFQPGLPFPYVPAAVGLTSPAEVARFYPLVTVLANRRMGVVRSTITLVRPRAAQPCHPLPNPPPAGKKAVAAPAADAPPPCHPGAPGATDDHAHHGHEGMTDDIRAGLFADHNGFKPWDALRDLPLWSMLFSHYRVARIPPDRKFVVVRPAGGKETDTTVPDAVRRHKAGEPRDPPKEPVCRVARQGAFENVHLAPHMVAPAAVLKAAGAADPDQTLKSISMAPFCHHDCLHVHWRWGAGLGLGDGHKYLKGWADGRPYARAGAPLVPENQTVIIAVPDGRTLVYTAGATAAEAGAWQIVFHHGGAYLLALRFPVEAVVESQSLSDLARDRGGQWWVAPTPGDDQSWGRTTARGPANWAMFYWQLQYLRVGGKVYPRVEYAGPAGEQALWGAEPPPDQN